MFTPEMLQKGLAALGLAAGQMRLLDRETKQALARFMLAAVMSGDANDYIQTRLRVVEEYDQEPDDPAPRTRRATARVVSEPVRKGVRK